MAIPNTTKREIPPTHPGEMLREDFMFDFDLNAIAVAEGLSTGPRDRLSPPRTQGTVADLFAAQGRVL